MSNLQIKLAILLSKPTYGWTAIPKFNGKIIKHYKDLTNTK